MADIESVDDAGLKPIGTYPAVGKYIYTGQCWSTRDRPDRRDGKISLFSPMMRTGKHFISSNKLT